MYIYINNIIYIKIILYIIYIYIHSEPQKKSEVVQELGDRMKQNEVREAMKNTTNS